MARTEPFVATPLPPIDSYDDIDIAVDTNDKLSAATSNECSRCYSVVRVDYLDDHVIVRAYKHSCRHGTRRSHTRLMMKSAC